MTRCFDSRRGLPGPRASSTHARQERNNADFPPVSQFSTSWGLSSSYECKPKRASISHLCWHQCCAFSVPQIYSNPSGIPEEWSTIPGGLLLPLRNSYSKKSQGRGGDVAQQYRIPLKIKYKQKTNELLPLVRVAKDNTTQPGTWRKKKLKCLRFQRVGLSRSQNIQVFCRVNTGFNILLSCARHGRTLYRNTDDS